jgi:hypothetical protein
MSMDKPGDAQSPSREPTAGQSARFRIKVDRLGRVIPEIEIVDDDDESAATPEPRPQPAR